MSRRQPTVQIEEEFDDDTDLPLPNAPLPNTGARGPLLEELNIDYDDPPMPSPSSQIPFSTRQSASSMTLPTPAEVLGKAGMGPSQSRTTVNTVTDITPYKKWSCIYPIYIDAKRPYGPGMRRLSREKSVWWPLSKDIADGATKLGFKVLHEVNKSHPRDWENPGRVRVQWRVEGTGVSVNPQIKTKKQLLELISMYIQHIKPENRPIPPYVSSSSPPPQDSTDALTSTANLSSSAKGKSKATSIFTPKVKSALSPSHTPLDFSSNSKHAGRRPPPAPPRHPPPSERVSQYSPALESGMLIDAVKAGMAAQESSGAPGVIGPGGSGGGGGQPGQGQGGPGAQQKGKRKVIRVRG